MDFVGLQTLRPAGKDISCPLSGLSKFRADKLTTNRIHNFGYQARIFIDFSSHFSATLVQY